MAPQTKRQKTVEIFQALDVGAQRQIIECVSTKGWDAAYPVAVALLHNQPLPAETVKEAQQPSRSDVFGNLLDGAARAQAATVQRQKNIIAAHQGVHDHRWWK